jgi:hypothetical protein
VSDQGLEAEAPQEIQQAQTIRATRYPDKHLLPGLEQVVMVDIGLHSF